MNRRSLTKSRHLTCVSGNYLSPGPSGRRRGNYSSELSGQSELPFGRRQTLQRAGGLPRRSSPGPAGPLTCRRRKIGAHDALPSRRRFCVFWESAEPAQVQGKTTKSGAACGQDARPNASMDSIGLPPRRVTITVPKRPIVEMARPRNANRRDQPGEPGGSRRGDDFDTPTAKVQIAFMPQVLGGL